jgi:ceramide glucosyltransferase
VIWQIVLAALAVLSFFLVLWQWLAARRFPLHARAISKVAPPVTLLKPLKGCDAEMEASLRTWFHQDYRGEIQILFGVASEDDPACAVVRRLIAEHPGRDAQLIICRESLGANAKVSSLIQLNRQARHEMIVVSDADVRVPPDLLENLLPPLCETNVGLVHCFYRLANPVTFGMRWEAVATNADFWSQVLQSRSLRPIDFALGAVMATTSTALREIGGFESLADYLADDYQLGNRIARTGRRIEFCSVVVECWEAPMTWRQVWAHQLRWARTIRVSQPVPYFFSILSNGTFWPAAWMIAQPEWVALLAGGTFILARIATALDQMEKLRGRGISRAWWWLIPLKDLLSVPIWAGSFLGNTVFWRGVRYTIRPGGRLDRN